MPLFPRETPSRDAVVAAWNTLFPHGARLATGEGGDGVDEYKIEGTRSVIVASIPAAVPNDEALHAVETSWMWQGSDEPIRSHRAHAIVTAVDHQRPIESAWDVARVSAAMLEAGAGVGLYWGTSRQVHMPKIAIGFATQAKPPVPLWVGITISGASKQGPFSAATHGLAELGHKEFEVRDTKMGIGDLRMTLLDLAAYVLDKGAVLEHGQTFGPSAKVRWTITHEPSQLVDDREVIVLGIP